MFAVVRFSKDSTVDVVPTYWLEDDKCYWPTNSNVSRALKAVKHREVPDVTFPKHDVIVLILSMEETFQRARSKLKKAENTDDIATSTDQEKGRGKRKRFAVFTSDDSDSDEPSCALPPPFRLRSCSNDGPSQRNTLPSSPSTFEQSAARVQIPAPEQSEVPAQPAVAEQPVPSTEEQDIHSAPPLDEQIDAVEVKLRSNKVFHEKLAQQLSGIGGTTVQSATARILAKWFYDSLGQKYSFYGQKGKKAFLKLELFQRAAKSSLDAERPARSNVERN